MSQCCSSTPKNASDPTKRACPQCSALASSVPTTTLLHHLKQPWQYTLDEQNYYFCKTQHCDVVYFNKTDQCINSASLRSAVGIKQESDEALICYCFGVTRRQAQSDPDIRNFVLQKTQEKLCACDVRNPSGKCCLKDFPRPNKGETHENR